MMGFDCSSESLSVVIPTIRERSDLGGVTSASNLIHPGEMIKDELEYRGITQRALAEELGVSPSVVNEILNGKRAVNIEFAMLLEAALGIEADLWIRLQPEYNKQLLKKDDSFMNRLRQIRNVASFL